MNLFLGTANLITDLTSSLTVKAGNCAGKQYLFIFLAIVLLFYGGYRYHSRRRREIHQIRTGIAADLHDDLGSTLSTLAVLTDKLQCRLETADPEIAELAASLQRATEDATDCLSHFVWATNPQLDSLLSLTSRMRRFASELLPAAGIEFMFHAPVDDLDLPLGQDLRRHIFLVFKESLNNIVRHSGSTKVVIDLRVEGATLLLKIDDNGRGFDPQGSYEGNGLNSLCRRARMLNAKLTLLSNPATGTTVALQVCCKPQRWRGGQGTETRASQPE